MANVNVNRNLTDQFYRYKMPKIIAKVEGKGNGIKTVIVNMTAVAKALNRPPSYTTKYFGFELGAQTQVDSKNDRYIVNGAHDATKLQDLLDGFIERFVLCPSCQNPETVLGISVKKGLISTKCKACGYSGILDSSHKLNTFIIKNPPAAQDVGTASASVGGRTTGNNTSPGTPGGGRAGKKSKKSLKVATDGSGSPQDSNENNKTNSSEVEASTATFNKDDDDDDWAVDTSEEAMARRMKDLSLRAKGLMRNDDLEKNEQERIDMLYAFVKQRLPIEAASSTTAYKDILGEAERLEVRDKAVLVLCELLLGTNCLAEIKLHRSLFLRLTHENKKAQRYLLGGIEQVVKLHKNVLLPRVSQILKLLYDEDIVDEESLLDWSKKLSKKYVGKDFAAEIHEKAAPFIKWLQEAEVEESSSDEEKEVNVVFSDRHLGGGLVEVKEKTALGSPASKNKCLP